MYVRVSEALDFGSDLGIWNLGVCVVVVSIFFSGILFFSVFLFFRGFWCFLSRVIKLRGFWDGGLLVI